MIKKLLIISIVIILLSSMITISDDTQKENYGSKGSILYVGGTGPGNYSKIQTAINDASDGDTVIVYNGTYQEDIEVNKQINLIGENKTNTIIDGNGYVVIYVRANWTNISGFTLQNGCLGLFVISDNYYSISNISITDNIITDNEEGIIVGDVSNIDISNNTIINNVDERGISTEESENVLISNNFISHGINIQYSEYCTLLNNSISEYGITCFFYKKSQCNTHTIESNTLAGIPIRYYKNSNNITIPTDTAQVILANCNNITIQKVNLSTSPSYNVQLGFSSDNKIIDNNNSILCYYSNNNLIMNNTIGFIYSRMSSNTTIKKNNCSRIFLLGHQNTIISDNYICSNDEYAGIEMVGGNATSIINNTITNNLWGVISEIPEYGNTIIGNNISNNVYSSIGVRNPYYSKNVDKDRMTKFLIAENVITNNGEDGINIYEEDNNVIRDNYISNNDKKGIRIDSGNNFIINNTICNNKETGIYLWTVYYDINTIYHNKFINNTLNAYERSNNNWDNGYPSGGNYWDDYNGSDLDGDGIGDTPYNISGTVQDNYPLGYFPPTADFSYSPSPPDTGETVFFMDESTKPETLASWLWDFGDGNTSSEQHPTHSYSNSELYTITLTVTNDIDQTDVHSKLLPVGLDLIHIQDVSNYWNLISLPFNGTLSKTDFLLKHDGCFYGLDDGIINEYLFGWNRQGQYYTFADNLESGFGYWLFSYVDCELLMVNNSIDYDDYITTLDSGWNTVGVPDNEIVNKTDLLVDNVPWDTAVTNGWVSNYIFGWDSIGQSYVFSDVFEPGEAYWMYAFQECVLKRDS